MRGTKSNVRHELRYTEQVVNEKDACSAGDSIFLRIVDTFAVLAYIYVRAVSLIRKIIPVPRITLCTTYVLLLGASAIPRL